MSDRFVWDFKDVEFVRKGGRGTVKVAKPTELKRNRKARRK